MHQTYVIGDIHGGYRALKQVLERAPLKHGDTIIFIGDFVDGWSECIETIEAIIELKQTYFVVCIKGNHDVWIQEYLKDGIADDVWLAHGGAITKEKYDAANDAIKAKHVEFYNSLLWYYIDAQERLFVHGGFTNRNGVEAEDDLTLVMDRSLWELAKSNKHRSSGSLLFPKKLKLYAETFIGHTPTTRSGSTIPVTYATVTNTDTGAAFGDRLSIVNIETKEFWQSDPLADLYPDETGRN